jgi:nucleoside-diphosphate kinase
VIDMERTLCIIKPDAVRKQVVGEIIAMIQAAGFRILGMQLTRISAEQAGAFYAVHKERPFYGELVNFMSSGPIVPIALEKENAVADWRALIGATDPAEAAEGTVRKRFASSKGENAAHGSDSVENGLNEVAFFFSEKDLVANR